MPAKGRCQQLHGNFAAGQRDVEARFQAAVCGVGLAAALTFITVAIGKHRHFAEMSLLEFV